MPAFATLVRAYGFALDSTKQLEFTPSHKAGEYRYESVCRRDAAFERTGMWNSDFRIGTPRLCGDPTHWVR